MPKVFALLKSSLPYEFIAVGVVWGIIAALVGVTVVLWPAVTCVLAGVLLKLQPSGRVTVPWATSSAVLGLLVSGYQAYVAIPMASGVFSTVAVETLVGFLVFAVVHLFLLYGGYRPLPGKGD